MEIRRWRHISAGDTHALRSWRGATSDVGSNPADVDGAALEDETALQSAFKILGRASRLYLEPQNAVGST